MANQIGSVDRRLSKFLRVEKYYELAAVLEKKIDYRSDIDEKNEITRVKPGLPELTPRTKHE